MAANEADPEEQQAPPDEAISAAAAPEADVEAKVEPEAAEPPPPPEPDPAEITGQAAAPRRGWWRRRE